MTIVFSHLRNPPTFLSWAAFFSNQTQQKMEVRVKSAIFYLTTTPENGGKSILYIIEYNLQKPFKQPFENYYTVTVKGSNDFYKKYSSERSLPSTDGAIKILQNAIK